MPRLTSGAHWARLPPPGSGHLPRQNRAAATGTQCDSVRGVSVIQERKKEVAKEHSGPTSSFAPFRGGGELFPELLPVALEPGGSGAVGFPLVESPIIF